MYHLELWPVVKSSFECKVLVPDAGWYAAVSQVPNVVAVPKCLVSQGLESIAVQHFVDMLDEGRRDKQTERKTYIINPNYIYIYIHIHDVLIYMVHMHISYT